MSKYFGPTQNYSLDVDYEMDQNNSLNLYLNYENTNQQFCQTTTTIDKNGDVYLNGKRVTGIRKAKNVQINNGRVYVDGKLVKDND